MAEVLDFSKIWAQNSPLDPYVFSDDNYLRGWNFIGAQPPDRGMFDAWMNLADKKLKYLFDNSASSESLSEHNSDSSAHSNLTLTMNDSLIPTKDTDMLVNLLSGLGRRFRDVTGKGNWYDAPDISLATLATLVSNLASGSDVSWSGSKFTNAKLGISGLMAQNGYIQFGPNFGGLIIQWGFSTSTATGVHVDFPIKFQTVLYGIQESHRADLRDDQKTAVIAGADLTGFGLYNSGTTGYGFNWLAIGR
ncbi:gp53-like domain-containing protein [Megasphaera stantonii]|uniref:gp53-like domain-containing protein n=1 Tax=Megasphaera stantonii TaxID=2144175 RepID=UPI00195906C7|nr:hypothetical protein [Megasphaera stantonii]MBM6731860.1 hypothetical protein [Megasphaera stantonii]